MSSVALHSEQATTRAIARVHGIDAVRFCAIAAVIFIHLPKIGSLGQLADALARFAVPFFFAASGYFLASSRRSETAEIARSAKRLLIPYVAWTAIYTWYAINFRGPQLDRLTPLRLLIDGGGGYHLWFLPSLFACTCLLVFARRLSNAALIASALALYVTGLALGTYAKPVLGFENEFWNMRDGPFFGFVFMAFGMVAARSGFRLSLGASLALLLASALGQVAEAYLINRYDQTILRDLQVSTVPYGCAAFLAALALPDRGWVRALAYLGERSLGVYLLHLLGIWIGLLLLPARTFADALAVAGFALIFATSASLALDSHPLTRFLVR
ncbi:MAG: acyltransferase [Pseudomonadota bacterium]